MRIDESLTNKFGQQIEVQGKSKRRLFLTVPKAIALEVCRFLKEELGARFSTISGVDTRSAVELLFHLPIDREHLVVTLRVPVAKPDLEMPTATGVYPAANWVEREIREMFGVNFLGHPNLQTLLLPDDWPAGVYPLRKHSYDSEIENTERE